MSFWLRLSSILAVGYQQWVWYSSNLDLRFGKNIFGLNCFCTLSNLFVLHLTSVSMIIEYHEGNVAQQCNLPRLDQAEQNCKLSVQIAPTPLYIYTIHGANT